MSYLYALSDTRLVSRLHEVGLLPEAERQRHIAAVRRLAVDTPDDGYLKTYIVGFLTTDERSEITQHVRETLLCDLGSCIDGWRDNWNPEDDPTGHFDDLKGALRSYRDALSEDDEVQGWIEAGIDHIDASIKEMEKHAESAPDDFEYRGHSTVLENSDPMRSTFDDVDE